MCLNQTNSFSLLHHAAIALCASFCLLSSTSLYAETEILATWDEWGETEDSSIHADETASGFSATVEGATPKNINERFGSNDTTFGAQVRAADRSGGALLIREHDGNTELTFTLTNNSGQDYRIDSLHFDFAPRQNASGSDQGYNTFVLRYVSGGLGPTNTQIGNATGSYEISGALNAKSDYPDYDYILTTHLTDTTLEHGESATFSIVFSGQNEPGQHTSSVLDNLAFQGTAIPTSIPQALLLLGSLGLIWFRHKK